MRDTVLWCLYPLLRNWKRENRGQTIDSVMYPFHDWRLGLDDCGIFVTGNCDPTGVLCSFVLFYCGRSHTVRVVHLQVMPILLRWRIIFSCTFSFSNVLYERVFFGSVLQIFTTKEIVTDDYRPLYVLVSPPGKCRSIFTLHSLVFRLFWCGVKEVRGSILREVERTDLYNDPL